MTGPSGPASAEPEWALIFVLPTLRLGDHQLSPHELTLGLEGIAIVSASDPRVEAVTTWSGAAKTFLDSFHDGNGTKIAPSVLIVRQDWLAAMKRNVEPVIAFRNAVAACCVLLARAGKLGGGWLGAAWSDTFDYHEAQLRIDGSKFDSWTPALNSIGFNLNGLSLTPDLRMPRNDLGPIDDHLATRLGRAWTLRYRRKRQLQATSRVFRSLEACYEATSLSFRNYSSLQEVGLTAVDWAIAVEVLASPSIRNVNKWDCIDLIGDGWFTQEPVIARTKYRVAMPRKAGQPLRFRSLNLPQWLFLQLHTARSKFVHGDHVTEKLLLPFGPGAPPLPALASTVYRIALVQYLERQWPWPVVAEDLPSMDLIPGMSYEDHLCAIVDEADE